MRALAVAAGWYSEGVISGVSGRVGICILWLASVLVQPSFSQTQDAAPAATPGATPILEQYAPEQMSAEDARIAAQRQAEIALLARFYGYNLKSEEWTYRETTSRYLADAFLLTYDARLPNQVTSRFVALVPRGSGRVHIIPAVLRGAVPLNKPYADPRNFALFNAVVPEDLRRRVMATDVGWLALGATYAAMVGGDPVIPHEGERETGNRIAVTRLNPNETTRIVVPDRSAEKGYTVWTVDFSKTGAVAGAEREDHWQPPSQLARMPSQNPGAVVRIPTANPKVVQRVPKPSQQPRDRVPSDSSSSTTQTAPQPTSAAPAPHSQARLPVRTEPVAAAPVVSTPAASAPVASVPQKAVVAQPSAAVMAPQTERVVVRPRTPADASAAVVRTPSKAAAPVVRTPAQETASVVHHPAAPAIGKATKPKPPAAPNVIRPADPAQAKVTPPSEQPQQ